MTDFFKQLKLGPFHNFSYVLGCPSTKKACFIDPGWESEKLLSVVEEWGFSLDAILITHHHPDQTQLVLELISKNNPQIYVHESKIGEWTFLSKKVCGVKDQDSVSVGDLQFQVFHTPGHTGDSVCYLLDDKIFTGDTLHVGSCGRCDLPESNPTLLYRSLYLKLKNLPEEFEVYPGHHYGSKPSSSLKEEFKTNPYLRFSSEEEFIRFRL